MWVEPMDTSIEKPTEQLNTPVLRFHSVSLQPENFGTNELGRLYIGDDGRLHFDGDMAESARIFFEEGLKPMCDNYIKKRLSEL